MNADINDIFGGPIQPLYFEDKDQPIKPLYNEDDHLKGSNIFVITRDTDNGKYVRGNLLCIKANGTEIATDINNSFFIDIHNKQILVKEYKNTHNIVSPEDPEVKQYILLLRSYDEEIDFPYTWEAMQGRVATYNYIVDNIGILNFNPDESLVLVSDISFNDAISITKFVKYLQSSNLVPEDDFDVDDYRIDEV